MAILNIIKVKDDVDGILRKVCKPVEKFDEKLHKLLDDMRDTALSNPTCAGLAAPQVGILKRVVVINLKDFYLELINPEITSKSDRLCSYLEGCLSVPGEVRKMARSIRVTVQYFDREGNKLSIKRTGWVSHLFQHELDHLDGIIFTDLPEVKNKEER